LKKDKWSVEEEYVLILVSEGSRVSFESETITVFLHLVNSDQLSDLCFSGYPCPRHRQMGCYTEEVSASSC